MGASLEGLLYLYTNFQVDACDPQPPSMLACTMDWSPKHLTGTSPPVLGAFLSVSSR